MTNHMIENVKNAKFLLPFFVLPIAAFGLYLMADMGGGMLGMWACDRFGLVGGAANKVLLLSIGLIALMVMLWVKLVEGRPIRDLGLVKRGFGKDASVGAVAGLLSFAAIAGLGMASKSVLFETADLSMANIASVLLTIPFWIVQAGSEELLTRGWVLPEVAAKTNRPVGILVSSALFVCLHINSGGITLLAVINIFLVGVLLAVFTLQRDSLWGAIMYHALWNFTQGSLLGLSVSGGSATKPNLFCFASKGNELLSGGAFGIEGSLLATGVLALSLAGLLFFSKGRN